MFTRFFQLALLAATASSALSSSISRELAGDFDWDIQPEDGFPVIAFNDTNEESEVVFKYNFTGTLTANKLLEVNLYQSDCITAADGSLAFVEAINGDELDIDLDIIQETISNSVHYKDVNLTNAVIGFCLRVDYNYIDNDNITESVNFYETNVTINVDLTANFTLTEITADRTAADNEAANADLDYPVEAYICVDDNSEVASPAALTQGSFLQVCIKIDDTVVTENVLVEDILLFVVSQPDGTATDSRPIVNAQADPLTDKVCREGGICNVKTQLPSKFFTDINPADLRVDGIAILAFGKASLMPSSAPSATVVRRLRAPIRGLITGDDVKAFMEAQRNMQEEASSAVAVAVPDSGRMLQAAAQSEFGLQVGLVGINGEVEGEGEGSSSSPAVAAVAVLVVLAGCVGLFFFFRAKKSRKEEITVENHTVSTNSFSGQQSYNGSMPQASLYSHSGQQATYRGKEPQFD
jgi:hypothetical protein